MTEEPAAHEPAGQQTAALHSALMHGGMTEEQASTVVAAIRDYVALVFIEHLALDHAKPKKRKKPKRKANKRNKRK